MIYLWIDREYVLYDTIRQEVLIFIGETSYITYKDVPYIVFNDTDSSSVAWFKKKIQIYIIWCII